MLALAGSSGCEADPCRVLCQSTGRAIGQCLAEWEAEWETLDASGEAAWSNRCQNDWDSVRADLEAREVPAAEAQCADASAELSGLADSERCDVLRALYVTE